jgi:FKBP-type peptidyl-prolyl cis-trans isomerase
MTLKSSPNTVREQRRIAHARKRRTRIILLAVLIVVGLALLATAIFYPRLNPGQGDQNPAAANPDFEIITTDSGLQYQDLAIGSGPVANPGDTVAVHYTGWLTDGTKFDSSLDRGRPFEFTLGEGGVIKDWDEGVAGMQPGGVRKLIIPAALGYGERGAGDVIPPGAILVFDVELVEIK